MTELRKQANRMAFNQAEDEFIDGEDTIGLGVIGKEGSGRLRAVAAQQRQKLSAKAQKKVRRWGGGAGRGRAGLRGGQGAAGAAGWGLRPCWRSGCAGRGVRCARPCCSRTPPTLLSPPHPYPCHPPPGPFMQFALKNYGSSGATSGLSSSLAFTPIQGIELANPNQAAQDDRCAAAGAGGWAAGATRGGIACWARAPGVAQTRRTPAQALRCAAHVRMCRRPRRRPPAHAACPAPPTPPTATCAACATAPSPTSQSTPASAPSAPSCPRTEAAAAWRAWTPLLSRPCFPAPLVAASRPCCSRLPCSLSPLP